MTDAQLDPQELEAIQDAIREAAPSRNASIAAAAAEPTALALMADARSVDVVRPLLVDAATRWARSAGKVLRTHLPGAWQLEVLGAEAIDGALAKDELRGGWLAGGKAGDVELVLAVHGPAIDIAAARRCGASAPPIENTRTPSRISLRLFQPVGRTLFDSWRMAWHEAFGRELVASGELEIVARLIDAHTVIRLSLAFTGELAGRVQIYARPEALLPAAPPTVAIKANASAIAAALAAVPVELVVELGKLRMPLSAIRTLEVGSTHTLPSFVDSRVPVYCAGVLKAWGKPVICRGVLAVEITSVVHGQGAPS